MTALYTRYRSQRFDALVGQDAAVRTLKNALASNRVAHAYLFTGIRGTGKTSTARILAKAVNCLGLVEGEPDNTCVNCVAINEASAMDLIEIDAASNRGVDEIRDLREKARYLPALLSRKVYIIDEAHQLTNEAFNALLKTLEEPPEHVLFILCTTESQKLPATIISRCQRFDFRRIGEDEIAARLAWIAEREDLPARPDGLALLASMAQGSMRDAITMLDQLASAGAEAIDGPTVRRQLGLVTQAELAGLLAAAAHGDVAAVLRQLEAMAAQGAEMRQLTSSLADISRKAVLLSIGAGDPATIGIEAAAEPAMAEVVAAGGRDFAARAFELAVGAGAEMRQSHEPRLLLEVTLLKLATHAGGVAPAVVAARALVAPAPAPAKPELPAAAPRPALAKPAPAAANEAPPAPVALAEPVQAGLAEVQARWSALLDALRGGSFAATRVRALLADASAVDVQADLLTIGFRFAIHSERVQEKVNRDELEKAIGQVYGRTFRLGFRVVPDLQAHPPAGPASAPAPAAAAATSPVPGSPAAGPPPVSAPAASSPSAAVPDGDPAGASPRAEAVAEGSDPVSGERLVQAAVEILGARITDIRPRQRPA